MPGVDRLAVVPLEAGPGEWRVEETVGGERLTARLSIRDGVHGRLEVDGDWPPRQVLLPPHRGGPRPGAARRSIEVIVDGWRFVVDVESARRAALRDLARRSRDVPVADGPAEVRAIIPGRVVSVAVTRGETVTSGARLLVVEAMKMQNELRAPRDGRVERVAVAEGETIEVGDLLVVLA